MGYRLSQLNSDSRLSLEIYRKEVNSLLTYSFSPDPLPGSESLFSRYFSMTPIESPASISHPPAISPLPPDALSISPIDPPSHAISRPHEPS